jgi:hypothetical protein
MPTGKMFRFALSALFIFMVCSISQADQTDTKKENSGLKKVAPQIMPPANVNKPEIYALEKTVGNPPPESGNKNTIKETWHVHPDFAVLGARTVAVIPMDNLSLEPNIEEVLYREVYERLQAKGYIKISTEHVRSVMKKLGITTPGQLAGISLKRLGDELKSDAILVGQIEQSGTIHAGIYDAVVVSCSLKLIRCACGSTLWQTEQWRTAHRQWNLDPFNMLINIVSHETASREKRVGWLVQEMLKTLPEGPIVVVEDNLLLKAQEIRITNEKK